MGWDIAPNNDASSLADRRTGVSLFVCGFVTRFPCRNTVKSSSERTIAPSGYLRPRRRPVGRRPVGRSGQSPRRNLRAERKRRGRVARCGYRLRWRILARMRRFLRPILRRPLPVFLVPTWDSVGLKKIEVATKRLNGNYSAYPMTPPIDKRTSSNDSLLPQENYTQIGARSERRSPKRRGFCR